MSSPGQAEQAERASERITITLPRELLDELRGYARRRSVPIAVLVRMLLSASMERERS